MVRLHPSWVLIGFFIILIAVGTVLLSLPQSMAGDGGISVLDALFTSASAATGTGLAVRDTASFWSPFGQRVLLALFQIGGLGSLVGSTILLLMIARRVGHEERFLFKEFMGVDSAWGIGVLILGITLYVLLVEAVGVYLLASHLSKTVPAHEALWLSIFHTVSAFNHAGFEIMGMANQLPDIPVQLILSGQSLLGAVSFIVIVDLVRGVFRRSLSLDTKLALSVSAFLVASGAAAILLWEWNNPQTLGNLPASQKLASAFFHSVSARTAGLSTLGIGSLVQPTLLVIIGLMFIGGASGSAAGGIKVNTFGLVAAVTWSFIRGKREVSVLGSVVHEEQVYRALAIGFISLVLIFAITIALSVTEGSDLLAHLFEAVSAFSTAGFSMGITPDLSQWGRLVIIFTMFVGRVGPLTLAFALSQRHRPTRGIYAREAVNLG